MGTASQPLGDIASGRRPDLDPFHPERPARPAADSQFKPSRLDARSHSPAGGGLPRIRDVADRQAAARTPEFDRRCQAGIHLPGRRSSTHHDQSRRGGIRSANRERYSPGCAARSSERRAHRTRRHRVPGAFSYRWSVAAAHEVFRRGRPASRFRAQIRGPARHFRTAAGAGWTIRRTHRRSRRRFPRGDDAVHLRREARPARPGPEIGFTWTDRPGHERANDGTLRGDHPLALRHDPCHGSDGLRKDLQPVCRALPSSIPSGSMS